MISYSSSKISLFLLFIAAITAGFAWFFHEKNQNPFFHIKINPQSFGYEIMVKRFDNQGKILNSLVSPSVINYADKNLTIFNKPNLYVFSENQQPWHISGNQAIVTQNTQVQLKGNVILKQDKGKNNSAIEILTNQLELNTETQTATTDQPLNLFNMATIILRPLFTQLVSMQIKKQVRFVYFHRQKFSLFQEVSDMLQVLKLKKFRIIHVFIFSFIFMTHILFALPSDNKQPATIQSDTGSYNRNNHISVLQGNVVIIQGTTKILADKVVIYTDQNDKLQRAIATGNPATYSTIQDKDKPPVVSTARQIDYNLQLNQVILTGNAKVVQGTNSLTSGKIVYNMKQQQVNTFPEHNIRTTLLFQPNQLSNLKTKS